MGKDGFNFEGLSRDKPAVEERDNFESKGKGDEKGPFKSVQLERDLPICFNFLMVMFGIMWYLMAVNKLGLDIEEGLAPGIKAVYSDSKLFLNNTIAQIDHFLDNNTAEFKKEFYTVVAGKLNDVGTDLGQNATNYNEITNILSYLNTTLSDYVTEDSIAFLDSLNNTINTLEELNNNINEYQQMEAWELLTSDDFFCDSWKYHLDSDSDLNYLDCDQLVQAKDNISEVDVTDFDNAINNLTDSLKLEEYLKPIQNLTNILVKGNTTLSCLSCNIEYTEVNDVVEMILENINLTSFKAREKFENISIVEPVGLNDTTDIIEEYGSYTRYILLCFPTIPISISVLLLLFGCLISMHGKENGRWKKHSENMLCAGNFMFLLMAIILGIPTLICFIFGGSVQRIACFTLELKDTDGAMMEPLDREVEEFITAAFDNPNYTESVTFSWQSIITNITELESNKTLYDILQLDIFFQDFFDELEDGVELFDQAADDICVNPMVLWSPFASSIDVHCGDIDELVTEIVTCASWDCNDTYVIENVSNIKAYLENAVECINGTQIDISKSPLVKIIKDTLMAMSDFATLSSTTTSSSHTPSTPSDTNTMASTYSTTITEGMFSLVKCYCFANYQTGIILSLPDTNILYATLYIIIQLCPPILQSHPSQGHHRPHLNHQKSPPRPVPTPQLLQMVCSAL